MPVGEIFGIATALLWSATAICFTEASKKIGTFQLNINRLSLAAVFLTLTILLAGIDYKISAEQILFLALSGLVGLVFGDTYLFKAYQTIGARNTQVLMTLAPAIAAVFGYILFYETISLLGISGMVITIAGVMIVVYQKDANGKRTMHSPRGIWYAFLGAVGQAGGLILAKQAFSYSPVNGFTATFFRIISAVAALYIMGWSTGRLKNPVPMFRENHSALKFTIAGTIMGPFLGITCSLIAISYAKIGIASTLMSISPVTMLPLVSYYYKEPIPAKGIAGAVVAVIGVAVLVLR